MVKVIYTGDISPCNIRIYDGKIKGWKKGETKELSEREAEKLVGDNKNFSLVGATKKKKTEEKPKEEEEPEKEEVDVDSMDKDELLDFTAKHNIEADYTMTVNKLREIIKEKIGENV